MDGTRQDAPTPADQKDSAGAETSTERNISAKWFAPLQPFDVYLAPPWLKLTADLLMEMEGVITVDFGDGGTVEVELCIAEILGSLMRKLRNLEGNLRNYVVQSAALANNAGREAYEQWISALCEARPVKVTRENLETNVLLAIEFQNRDFFRALWADGVVSEMSGDHIFVREKHHSLISGFLNQARLEWSGLWTKEDVTSLWNFDIEVLERAGVDVLNGVLNGRSYNEAHESELCNTLVRLSQRDGSYVPLFDNVFFDNLDRETLARVFTCLGDNCRHLTGPHFLKLLDGSPKWPGNDPNSTTVNPRAIDRWRQQFPLVHPGESGIISHLSQLRGNVHDAKIVFCSASSALPGCEAKNATHRQKEQFCSYPGKNAWLQYDFIKKAVHPTAYYVDAKYLDDWVLEGRQTASARWELLDVRVKQAANFAVRGEGCYKLAVDGKKSYRFIRIRQTGNTQRGMEVWFFELYGAIE